MKKLTKVQEQISDVLMAAAGGEISYRKATKVVEKLCDKNGISRDKINYEDGYAVGVWFGPAPTLH